MNAHCLSALPVGSAGHVAGLSGEAAMRRRLLDLGFTAGAHVRCLFESPTGNPRAYRVRGAVIALRNRDAASIRLEGGIP